MKYQPKEYMLKAIGHVVSRACAALFLDPGLGKTAIMYAAFSLLKKKRFVRKMLVIAPLRPAYSVWPAEAEKWDDFNHLKVVVLHGPDKEALLRSDADVFVINPEGLKWLFAHDWKEWPWDVLCVDESTRFKHVNTDRFKLLKPTLPRFARRYILTGSPAPNGLLDLFGQVYILDLGSALGRYITHYRLAYFDNPDRQGWLWVPREGAEERIYKKMGPLALRMAATDYLTLPPLVGACGSNSDPLVTWVDLPPDARRAYDEMETLLVAEVKAGKVVAANASVASGKCRQIANGGLYASDGAPLNLRTTSLTRDLAYHLHEAKVDAVEEIIEEASGVPTLVAYEFDHDLTRLRRRFGPDTPYIGGGVTPKRFKEIERGWNAGEIPILLAQPQSVAHGLNLQATRANVIWHSLTWDFEAYEQFYKRVWRQGQQHTVFVHHVLARNTVDRLILNALMRKDRTQRALLDALKDL